MSYNATLKAAIAAAIHTPADPPITGADLQAQLLSMVDGFGAGALFMGTATPASIPTTEANCFFLATTEGTYTNFLDTGGNAIALAAGEAALIRSTIINDSLRWQKLTIATGGGGGGTPQLVVNTTHAALKALRDGGNLVPGTWYRITDYVCTTTQDYTQSAEHAFDVIVRADDTSHLNENAFAAHHEGDEYFANCKLGAWELKYSLDNDTNRFAWADEENGTGVIFYMKDEWNNECPYDFKNIMSQRWAIQECENCPSLEEESEDNTGGYYYGAKTLSGDNVLGNATYGQESDWFYTFALKDLASDEWYDYTVVAHLGLKNDEGIEVACYDNHIVEGTDEYNSGKGKMAKMLNNIVFFNCYGDLSDTSYSDDYSYCNNNRFLGKCHSNTFGNECFNNSFGNDCGGNTFGNDCRQNSFGNGCASNTFGNDCYSNSFGNYCNRNSFGNYCQTITVFDGVQNCSVTGGSQSAPVKNAQILNGTAGASTQNKLTIAFAANKAYTQVAAKTTAGNLKVFNPADLVQ